MEFVITLEVCRHEQIKRVNFTLFKVESTLDILTPYLLMITLENRMITLKRF
jgi:hypothetical protein